MSTEATDAKYEGIDAKPNEQILDAFADVQEHAVKAVRVAHPQIAAAAQAITERLGKEGRLIYVGGGASGRLGALDAMEIAPTFDFPNDRLVIAMAEEPIFKPGTGAEGREDKADLATAKANKIGLRPQDVVIAITASGNTPYTRQFAEEAKKSGSLVIGIANNRNAALFAQCDHSIMLDTGPEAIRGSTRMGAATAQRIALVELSSLAMTKLPGIHGVYDGHMINMRPASYSKLARREIQTVTEIAKCKPEAAVAALELANHDMKAACLIAKGATLAYAQKLLDETQRNLRAALILQLKAPAVEPKSPIRPANDRPPTPPSLSA